MIKEKKRGEREQGTKGRGEGKTKGGEREQGKKWGRVKKTEKERLRVCTD